jgi:tripartite-type tricarboxylate transporter receptor subunit TctC
LEVAMKMPLSLSILGLVSLFATVTAAQQPARAEAYPTRPVKVIVPDQPGAAADVIAGAFAALQAAGTTALVISANP